jgi:hypothetical protein
MTDVKPLTAKQIYSKEYYQKNKIRINQTQKIYTKKNSIKSYNSVCVITPDQINDVIISNQNHLKFIEECRKCRVENTLMSAEDSRY